MCPSRLIRRCFLGRWNATTSRAPSPRLSPPVGEVGERVPERRVRVECPAFVCRRVAYNGLCAVGCPHPTDAWPKALLRIHKRVSAASPLSHPHPAKHRYTTAPLRSAGSGEAISSLPAHHPPFVGGPPRRVLVCPATYWILCAVGWPHPTAGTALNAVLRVSVPTDAPSSHLALEIRRPILLFTPSFTGAY